MHSNFKRVPMRTWESHKATISELIQTHSLADIREFMRENHGFEATENQYLRKLRSWNLAVSNIRKEDWRVIFYHLRALSSQGIKGRVVQSGKPLSEARIERARRYVKGGIGETDSVYPSAEAGSHRLRNVVIEKQQQGGEWILYATFTENNDARETCEPVTNTSSVPVLPSGGDTIQGGNPVSTGDASPEAALPDNIAFADPLDDLFPSGFCRDIVHSNNLMLGEDNLEILSPNTLGESRDLVGAAQFNITWAAMEEFHFLAANPHRAPSICSILDFSKKSSQPQDYVAQASFFWSKLEDLPSIHFLPWPLTDQASVLRLLVDSSDALPTVWDRVQSVVQDVAERATEDNRFSYLIPQQLAKITLRSIRSRFPGLSTCNAEEVGQSLIQGIDIADTLFTRALIFSMANGLVGLEPAFVSGMIKQLYRNSGSLSLFTAMLNSSPRYFASGLVETLYNTAIATEDDQVLRWLLSLDHFNHVRDIFLFETFETACDISNGQLAEFMLDSGLVDVITILKSDILPESKHHWILQLSKLDDASHLKEALATTLQPHPQDYAPWVLDILRYFLSRAKGQISNHHIEVVGILLRHGAMRDPKMFANYMERGSVEQSFLKLLCQSIMDWKHDALVSSHNLEDDSCCLFSDILARFDDNIAAKLLRHFQKKCQAAGCNRCLTTEANSSHIMMTAASHGLVQVMRLLVPYVTEPALVRALSVTIRNGSKEGVQLLLDQGIDLSLPPQDIGSFDYHIGQYSIYILTASTPLAEAIIAQDEELISVLEGLGGLQNLNLYRFENLVTAAVAAQNDEYVAKLLRAYSQPLFRLHEDYLDDCLSLAIIQSRHRMFDQLLHAGAKMGTFTNIKHVVNHGITHQLTAIMAAFEMKNEYIVLRLLRDYGANIEAQEARSCETWLFREAARWGSRMVFEALKRLSPGFKMKSFVGGRGESKELFSTYDVDEIPEAGYCEVSQQAISQAVFLAEAGVMTAAGLDGVIQVVIYQGDESMFQTLLDLEADPFSHRVGMLCLAHAVRSSNANMLPLLLDRLSQGYPRRHDLQIAALYGLQEAVAGGANSAESIDRLLRSGLLDPVTLCTSFTPSIRVDSAMDRPRTAILYHAIMACVGGEISDFSVLEKLLEAGCDVNAVVFEGNRGRWTDMARELYPESSLPLVEESDSEFSNCTAIVAAIATGCESLVKMLLDHRADPNEEVGYGKKHTPLQKAAQIGSFPIVKLLLERGADVNAHPAFRGGATAFQFAAISGNPVMAAELLRYGADLAQAPSPVDGRWPLEGAAEHGRISMIEYLCTISSNGFPESQWQRAIFLAGRNRKLACEDFLKKLYSSFQATGSFKSVIDADSPHRVMLG